MNAMPALSRRHNWTHTDAEEALARLVANADLIGHSEEALPAACGGERGAFLLVAVDAELMQYLAAFGADTEDAEDADPAEPNGDEQDGDGTEDEFGEDRAGAAYYPLGRAAPWEATGRPGEAWNPASGEFLRIHRRRTA